MPSCSLLGDWAAVGPDWGPGHTEECLWVDDKLSRDHVRLKGL